ncbi:hypothetical protein [Pantoea sp. 18069]|uniref:hypothetical protein n=1 Tax=Pantoea sp. 18069 TaxID=2681415 RepID=UPI00135A1EA7|nr:hypothetical protein [Pantoea sp. 18069]
MFARIKAYAWQLLAVLLLASLSGNGVLGWAYLGQRDAAAVARASIVGVERERDGARAAAQACSDGVEGLESAAAQRHAKAEPARAAAAAQALALNQRADYTLSTAPAAPGDACASAQALGAAWLKGRAKP